MPQLFLHGGAPKTGTSYIQVLLARHAEALAQAGLVYPPGHLFETAKKGGITSGNGVEMANYINPALPHQIPDKDAFLGTFVRHLEEAEGRDVAYSSEALRFPPGERAERIVETAVRHGYTPTYVYLVRDIDGLLLSSYSQLVKRHGETRPMSAFITDWNPPYVPAIRQAETVLGAQNVAIHNYDANKDRLGAYFVREVFGLDLDLPEEALVVNRSLGVKEIAMMRHVNAVAGGAHRVSTFVSDAIISADGGDTPMRLCRADADRLARLENVVAFVNARIRGPHIRLAGDVAAEATDATLTPVEAAMAATLARLVMRGAKV